MWFKKLLVLSAALAGVTFSAGEAKADYVCSAYYSPANSTHGTQGKTQLIVNTEPNCEGDLVGVYYLCSASATNTMCASSANARYERHGLLAVFQAGQRAAESNQVVEVSTTTCIGGNSNNCANVVFFEAL